MLISAIPPSSQFEGSVITTVLQHDRSETAWSLSAGPSRTRRVDPVQARRVYVRGAERNRRATRLVRCVRARGGGVIAEEIVRLLLCTG